MAGYLPQFNLLGSIWGFVSTPAGGPPDYVDVPMQLYINTKHSLDTGSAGAIIWVPPIYVRMPNSVFIEWTNGTIFEPVPGSGEFYRAQWKEYAHRGFPNEYFLTLVMQCDANGLLIDRYTSDT